MKLTGLDTSHPFAWSATTISRILENETYLGVTVNMKTTTISYKNKKRIDRPESEQFRFEGTHEALIDKQTWEIVQDNRRHKQISAMTKRQSELMSLFKRLYEDNVLGRISDEQYRILSTEYTSEQESIKAPLPELTAHLQELKASTSNFDRFLENARKYTEINDLTSELLHTFIKRIEVGERAKKYSRNAPQDIVIHYRDIGIIDDMPQELEEILHQVAEMEGDVTYTLQEPMFPTGS